MVGQTTFRIVVACVLALFSMSCSGSTDSSGETIDLSGENNAAGTMGSGMLPGDEVEPVSCEKNGIDIISTEVSVQEYGLQIRAITSEMAPIDNLIIRLYSGRATAPREPGVVVMDGVNYKDCGICPLIMSDCTQRGACTKVFYASQGEIDIQSLSDNRFVATLKNLVFDHVTVSDELSIPVEGGDQWCLNDFTIDEEYDGTIPHSGGGDPGGGGGGGRPSQCDNPNLACVGDTVNDFALTNCGTGEQVSMRDHFAGAKAGWFVLTAGWCGACSGWMPQVVSMLNNPQVSGLKAAVILSESPDHMPATQRYCQQYASQYDMPLESIFLDHSGGRAYATIFQNVWPYVGPDGRFGLPFNALIDAESFEYIYADRGPAGSLSQAMQGLLR
ncbi:MAG: hypothetical protein CMH52_06105 [Myxococcales bacterium]|nr:hypothetical protein [Myxococcales bacterium]|tara:strand:- start:595 stop:1758 length:1164 start_codon:yes stop_codon:yes gene_type:complete